MKPCEIKGCDNHASQEAEVGFFSISGTIWRRRYILICDAHATLLRTPIIGNIRTMDDLKIVKVIEIGNPMLLREHMP